MKLSLVLLLIISQLFSCGPGRKTTESEAKMAAPFCLVLAPAPLAALSCTVAVTGAQAWYVTVFVSGAVVAGASVTASAGVKNATVGKYTVKLTPVAVPKPVPKP